MGYFRCRKKWKDKSLEEKVECLRKARWVELLTSVDLILICLVLLAVLICLVLLAVEMDLGWI